MCWLNIKLFRCLKWSLPFAGYNEKSSEPAAAILFLFWSSLFGMGGRKNCLPTDSEWNFRNWQSVDEFHGHNFWHSVDNFSNVVAIILPNGVWDVFVSFDCLFIYLTMVHAFSDVLEINVRLSVNVILSKWKWKIAKTMSLSLSLSLSIVRIRSFSVQHHLSQFWKNPKPKPKTKKGRKRKTTKMLP